MGVGGWGGLGGGGGGGGLGVGGWVGGGGGISFSTPWKIKSDLRKSHGFLFFITFYVESKLEWRFYGQ